MSLRCLLNTLKTREAAIFEKVEEGRWSEGRLYPKA